MKRQFFHYKLAVIPLLLLFCSVDAQTTRMDANLDNTPPKEVAFSNATDDKELPNLAVSTKALKNFSKHYKESENAEWFKLDNAFRAQYTKDDVETSVFYNLKGKWMGNIRTYSEDKLPGDIRHRVRSTYYDYSIFHVQEITVGAKTAYLVNIEDKNFIKIIRIANDEMSEYQVIEKSSR